MKEVEMIEKVKALFVGHILGYDNSSVSDEEKTEDAESIVKLILDAGMLPPYREKTAEEKEKIDAINQYNYCHRWEKVDVRKKA